jgi:hypothetical protein
VKCTMMRCNSMSCGTPIGRPSREWIAAIKEEETLASADHSVAEIDQWERAHFREDKMRSKVKTAKKQYEDALRQRLYGF